MNLEQLYALWEEDSTINPANVTAESAKNPKQHHKYLQLLVAARLQLHDLQAAVKVLRLEKYELYDQGPSKETKKKYDYWKAPAKGAATSKKELDLYLEADVDIIAKNKELAVQQEIVNVLEAIMNNINARSFHLRLILDDQKFKSGG